MSEDRLLNPEEYLGFSLLAEKYPSHFDLALRAQDAKSIKLERQRIGEWLENRASKSWQGSTTDPLTHATFRISEIEALKKGESIEGGGWITQGKE